MSVSKILFHRLYKQFTGGHLKFNDYLNHTQSLASLRTSIFVDPSSNPNHLWREHPGLTDVYDPISADILFIAGTDWTALASYPGIDQQKLIINLIQGIRHADPTHELYYYLNRKAIRICVSHEVGDAILKTGQCNGPIHVIPNGLSHHSLPERSLTPKCDVFIAGLKFKKLAQDLGTHLESLGFSVDCLTHHIPRHQYLIRVSQARCAVTLPLPAEGFYLPALEAMAMGVLLVCPDCIGNRSFCVDGLTCLVPKYDLESIKKAVASILSNDALADDLRRNAIEKSHIYSLGKERNAFVELLSHYALGGIA
jgi:hypothetical protein